MDLFTAHLTIWQFRYLFAFFLHRRFLWFPWKYANHLPSAGFAFSFCSIFILFVVHCNLAAALCILYPLFLFPFQLPAPSFSPSGLANCIFCICLWVGVSSLLSLPAAALWPSLSPSPFTHLVRGPSRVCSSAESTVSRSLQYFSKFHCISMWSLWIIVLFNRVSMVFWL